MLHINYFKNKKLIVNAFKTSLLSPDGKEYYSFKECTNSSIVDKNVIYTFEFQNIKVYNDFKMRFEKGIYFSLFNNETNKLHVVFNDIVFPSFSKIKDYLFLQQANGVSIKHFTPIYYKLKVIK